MPALLPMQTQIQQVPHQALQQSPTGLPSGTAQSPSFFQAASAAMQHAAAPAVLAASPQPA
eukprot:4684894-Pyramimonas_sp.AAC.1